ncbi:hypothetical protein [Streptococcus sp. E17BB]|uniref:hypothetical protein n=1 Tax=Streptococcus sp. E17BB TaxID=3278714 RepID=UPI00359CCEDD
MTITTRFATPADAATICAICSAAWRVTYKDLNPPGYIEQVIADFYNLDRVTKECSTSDQHWHGYMVAELDGHILGAIGGGVSEGNFGISMSSMFTQSTRVRDWDVLSLIF